MELVSLAKEVFQNFAEHAASYRLGQTALRHLDRSLWVVEKCARWAVPPPLDQDERPQPELVRPLPWVFFLIMLVTLRVARESISLLNLVMGKPPLRSADVVMFIQSKRRYLRTLKYQGNRMMRARTSTAPRESWSTAVSSMLEFTMCFRRHSPHYGNNNNTSISNNEEVLVVKRSKGGREQSSPLSSETTMERLIEKMMVDLDADTDEDSSFTLTNITSAKSDRSDLTAESDQDTVFQNHILNQSGSDTGPGTPFPPNIAPSSTPEKSPEHGKENALIKSASSAGDQEVPKENVPPTDTELSAKELANKFILQESTPSKIPRTPKHEVKIANGRTVKSVPSKKKGTPMMDKAKRTNSDPYVGTNHQTSANTTL